MMWLINLLNRLFLAVAGIPSKPINLHYEMSYVKYRGYLITQEWASRIGPPQPDEWCYAHEAYEGSDDHRCGCCPTLEECKEEIDDNIQLENYAVGLVDPAELKRQGRDNGRVH